MTEDFHEVRSGLSAMQHKTQGLLKITINQFKTKMANHKSSLKRIRQDKKKALHNKYYAKTMRNAVRKLRNMSDKEEAAKLYPTVQKLLDKLAKINVIHDNKAANLKSGLTKHIAKLA